MAMVKANAYGHGLVPVAKALDEADAFGVASLEEALKLRQAGIQQEIILMEGLFQREELEEAMQHRLSLVVHHEPHIALLAEAPVQAHFSIWLKINTGMNRLGFPAASVGNRYARLQTLPAVKKIGLMSHFAKADAIHSECTRQQITLFNSVTAPFPKEPRSLANSAGILAWPASHQQWVRPGLMLYGASPFPDQTGPDHQLKPVMTLRSKIIAISTIQHGEKVGYGGTWSAPETMLVGVVAAGYGDGYPQSAQNGTPVLVNNQICPLVGRVSMDMLTVDLRRQPDAKIGDPVTLWGEGLPVETIARHNHTSPYEILTRITARPPVRLASEVSDTVYKETF